MTDSVTYQLEGDVAFIQFDDSKANVITPDVVGSLCEAFDRAEQESSCVVWTGRPGRFCAGFDLGVLSARGPVALDMLKSGAELASRLYSFPIPVVIGCSGHALGMGAIYLLAADVRVAVQGEFKIGLPEVAMGMTMPGFGIELSQARLARTHLSRAVCGAEIFDPEGAAEAGFVDILVPTEQFQERLLATALGLTALNRVAYHETKLALRADSMARLRTSLDDFEL